MDASSPAVFEDRRDAGRRLAARLERFRHEAPIVLALPRGGVPVADTIAEALAAPLDLLVTRSLGEPGYRVGAVAEGGLSIVDHERARLLGIDAETLMAMRGRASLAVQAAARRLRDGRARLDVVGRTVLVVDDGMGSGNSAAAAVRTVRRRGAARIVLAVPVAGPAALERLRAEADEVVCLEQASTARWYARAGRVSDAEITAALADRPEPGHLHLPEGARGVVVVAAADGVVRAALSAMGFATLAAGSHDEADSLAGAVRWLRGLPSVRDLAIGCFGAGPTAETVLGAAALTTEISAVVAAGGHPERVTAPSGAATLLVIGGEDRELLELERASGRYEIAVVAGASHDFAEPGALEQVAHLAGGWFAHHTW
jgi:predicted phosphoribosyltransferase